MSSSLPGRRLARPARYLVLSLTIHAAALGAVAAVQGIRGGRSRGEPAGPPPPVAILLRDALEPPEAIIEDRPVSFEPPSMPSFPPEVRPFAVEPAQQPLDPEEPPPAASAIVESPRFVFDAPVVRAEPEEVSPPVLAASPALGPQPAPLGEEPPGPEPALVMHHERPAYPARAVRLGQEGEVLLLAVVRPDGSLESLDVARSSGHRLLDDAALECVRRRWVFSRLEGTSSRLRRVEIPFRFRIESPGI